MPENKSRLRLLQQRNKRRMVEKVAKVLSDKRDALMKEFHGMARRALKVRRDLEKKIETASRSLLFAGGIEPHGRLTTAALAAKKSELCHVGVKNIWGVKLPVVEYSELHRGLFERGSAPGYRSPVVDETAARFESVNNALVTSAIAENHIKVIGGALRSTNRRVNALEKMILPEIESEIERIRRYLEEMSREEVFRLKRYKKLKRENGGDIARFAGGRTR